MNRLAMLVLVLGMVTGQAYAANDSQPVSNVSKWKTECGSCHVPYPPHMLSADNWKTLMGSLNKHFGANAVLDAKDNKLILGFLERNAGNGARYSSTSLRISDTPWFKHEHRVIAAQEWVHPDVRSRSNCSACHGKEVLGY